MRFTLESLFIMNHFSSEIVAKQTKIDLCGKHEATMKNLKNVKCW